VLAGVGQLAEDNLDQAFADFTDPMGSTVGLTSFGLAFLLDGLLTVPSRIEDAFQTAATADMDFLAGLPGLLS
jgi:hypothetical protein